MELPRLVHSPLYPHFGCRQSLRAKARSLPQLQNNKPLSGGPRDRVPPQPAVILEKNVQHPRDLAFLHFDLNLTSDNGFIYNPRLWSEAKLAQESSFNQHNRKVNSNLYGFPPATSAAITFSQRSSSVADPKSGFLIAGKFNNGCNWNVPQLCLCSVFGIERRADVQ